MAKPKLVLYVDLISPFAYFAFHVIRTSPVFKACEITYVPVLLGGIMQSTGNRPPLQIKNKGPYSNTDRLRWMRHFNIPMSESLPEGWPYVTLAAMRILTAIAQTYPPKTLEDVLARLYHESFVHHRLFQTLELARPVLVEMLGQEEAAKVLDLATSHQVKAALKTNTDEVVNMGSFGLPWYVATDVQGHTEMFWGFDHLGQVARHLGLEKPGPVGLEDGWKAML